MQKIIQPSFSAGELTPSMAGRVDLAKYRVGAALMENFIPLSHGGVSNRSGTKFVGELADGPARLIPFRFSTIQTYALVFTNHKMRIVKDGGLVEFPVGSVDALDSVTPISSSDAASHAKGLAFDSNDTTYWQSNVGGAFSVNAEYIGQDFGAAVKIGRFDILQGILTGDATDSDFQTPTVKLEYSDNGSSWTTHQTFTITTNDNDVAAQQCVVTTPNQTHRYWRILQAAATNGGTSKWGVRSLIFYANNAGEVVEITSPYAYADLAKLKYVQSADVMFFAHNNYPPYSLTRTSHTAWDFETISFLTDTPSPTGLTAVYNDGDGSPAATRDVRYEVSTVFPDGSESLPSTDAVATVDSPWFGGATVALNWTAVAGATGYRIYKNARGFFGQIGAVYKDTAKIFPSAKLSSSDHSTDVKANAFDSVTDTYWTSGETGIANIENISYIGQDCGSAKTVTRVRLLQGQKKHGNQTCASMNLQYSDDGSSWFTLESWTPPTTTQHVWQEFRPTSPQSHRYWRLLATDFPAIPGFDTLRWRVAEVEFHENGIPTAFTDDNITEDGTQGPLFDNDPFTPQSDGDTDHFPGAVGIFQQRLWYARTNANPETLWATPSGQFGNMSVSVPIRADNALQFTVDGREVNAITHLIPVTKLLLLTSGGESVLSGANGLDAITPTSVSLRVQGYRGCTDVSPIVIGHSILFVQRNGAVVREMQYNFGEDIFESNNASVLSQHLFDNHEVIDWAYQQDPNSVVWAVRDDGVLLSLTYLREQDVLGWARHTTDGEFLSVCSIDEGNGQDEVYFITLRERVVDDILVQFYCVEQMVHRLPNDLLVNGVFMDCALSYSGSPLTTFGGLDHLIGLEVSILADGSVPARQTVSATGTITLANAASIVHVGLPYTSNLQTMRLEYDAQGTAQGRKRKVSKVFIRMDKTRAFTIGPDEEHLTPMKFRDGENFDAPTAMKTGDSWLNIDARWSTDCQIYVRNEDPLPVTILALIPEIETSSTA